MRNPLLLVAIYSALVLSLPTEPQPKTVPPKPAQQVHLVFHAAPVQYELTIPADGKCHPINNGLNVNLIDAPDFDIERCEFQTKGPATFVWQTTAGPNGWRVSQYAVGPPQVILGVTCWGTCLGVYSAFLFLFFFFFSLLTTVACILTQTWFVLC